MSSARIIDENNPPPSSQGRNQLCTCKSGRKYKKCCLLIYNRRCKATWDRYYDDEAQKPEGEKGWDNLIMQ